MRSDGFCYRLILFIRGQERLFLYVAAMSLILVSGRRILPQLAVFLYGRPGDFF